MSSLAEKEEQFEWWVTIMYDRIKEMKSEVPRISREAPAFGNKAGGSIEIVVPINGVQLDSFHTIKF